MRAVDTLIKLLLMDVPPTNVGGFASTKSTSVTSISTHIAGWNSPVVEVTPRNRGYVVYGRDATEAWLSPCRACPVEHCLEWSGW